MVALCGATTNFVQLLFVRTGVAIGEAGCLPPAHSLIADYYRRGERPRALAVYLLGGGLGVAVASLAAGWLNEVYGWRATFVILSLPGLALAALARLTLIEPRLMRFAHGVVGASRPALDEVPPRLSEVCVRLWSSVTFRHLTLYFSVSSFFGSGIGQWLPAFFARSHGIASGELGAWFGAIYGIGMLGTYLGGMLSSRYAANDEQLQLRVVMIVMTCFGVLSSGVYLVQNKYIALGLIALSGFAMNAANGPMFATIQTLVPKRMRAVSIAFIYLLANLIGLGLGPLVVGMLSDALHPWAGEQSLRYALLAMCPGYLWGGWHLWRASRHVTRDLAAVEALRSDAATAAAQLSA
jgi:MFS family permease